MQTLEVLTIILVSLGALFLLISILQSRRGTRYVPATLQARWRLILYFICFFLVGYFLFLTIRISGWVFFPLELVTSSIFLGGAFFVFLVTNLALGTIRKMWEGEKELAQVNQQLLEQNQVLQSEIAERERAQEQARSRLQHLTTLHAIDTVITSSLDLQVTLNVFLEQVLPQLNVSAVEVLLFDSHTQQLEYGASRGFRTRDIERSRVRLGQGSAGRVALERRMLFIKRLADEPQRFYRKGLIEGEDFISYCAVALTARGQVKGVFELFHRQELDPDPEWFEFLEALAVQAAIAIDNATLFHDLQRSNAELIMAYDTTIEGWSRALELRDKDTEGHTRRVTEMTLAMARKFEMSEEELAQVARGALLHDIGKMGVPDAILLKPGPLTEEEWEIMRKHPQYAFEMLSPIRYLRAALDIPYCHHEKWDGSGYPRGLKGEQIPLAARIFSVADMWDALLSKRQYHEPWPPEKVCGHIRELAGSHFDPRVVEVFLQGWCADPVGGPPDAAESTALREGHHPQALEPALVPRTP